MTCRRGRLERDARAMVELVLVVFYFFQGSKEKIGK